VAGESPEEGTEEAAEGEASSKSYRRQRRGGKGIRDIRTTSRNGAVVKIASVASGDEVLMITAQGMIQRIRVEDISEIGRNTQGVRVMRLDESDKIVSLARIPADLVDDGERDAQ
jgi:DNA gyrase subunit A